MDKIRALLEQLGGYKELVNQICESLDAYRDKLEADTKKDYTERLDKAKQVCIEEVQKYKQDLARKTQIFLESRADKIEQQIAKQVAIKDSAAESKLQAIAGLLEGIEVNSEGNDADLQAAKKQVKKLQEHVKKADSERKIIAAKAGRAHAVAEKTLERNKVLSKELVEATKKTKKPISESKGKGKPKTKKSRKATIAEGRKKKASPKTTRKSAESQIAKPKKKTQGPSSTMGGFSPNTIAAGMET